MKREGEVCVHNVRHKKMSGLKVVFSVECESCGSFFVTLQYFNI